MATFLHEVFVAIVDWVFYGVGHLVLRILRLEIRDKHKRDIWVTAIGATVFAAFIIVIVVLAH